MTEKFKPGIIVKYSILLIILGLSIFISLSFGTRAFSPGTVVDALFGNLRGVDYTIIIYLRLPRILMALIIGASLSVSGTVFQAVLKNPLADPFIIGVSGGAALGATIGILLSGSSLAITLSAFAGSISTITLVYLLSRRIRLGTTPLILSGIALGFILSATVLLLFSLARSEEVHKTLIWLMGDLTGAKYSMLAPMGLVSAVLILLVLLFSKHLDILSFGDRFSRNLGVTEGNVRILFWTASLLAAISVAMAGVIGFIGLIVPHTMRYLFGPGHLRLVPSAAFGGAILLLLSDTLCRSVVPPYEIPVGIVTSFFGGIFFLIYMITKRGMKI